LTKITSCTVHGPEMLKVSSEFLIISLKFENKDGNANFKGSIKTFID